MLSKTFFNRKKWEQFNQILFSDGLAILSTQKYINLVIKDKLDYQDKASCCVQKIKKK